MDINLLDGNVHRYKKEGCSGNFFILGCMDARGRVWAFEVGERSEVGALESLSPQKKKGVPKKELLFFFVRRTGPSHTHGRGLLSRPSRSE